MSYYVKRIAVIKQVGAGFGANGKTVSGLCRLEKIGSEGKITMSLLNFAPIERGTYYVVLKGDQIGYRYIMLGSAPTTDNYILENIFDADGGFACLICFYSPEQGVKNVAFGVSGIVDCEIEDMKNYLIEQNSVKTKEPNKEKKEEKPNDESDDLSRLKKDLSYINDALKKSCSDSDYEDELVATENYFLKDDVDAVNLKVVDEFSSDKGDRNEFKNNKNEDTYDFFEQKDEEMPKPKPPATDEERVNLFADPYTFDFDATLKQSYFEKVKKELFKVLDENEPETVLQNSIPCSRFSKIFYAQDKFYIVGVIYEKNTPKYICYGVPAKYSKEPPKELKGFCSYLPLSIFDLKGDGYWMMYQDADNGTCVSIESF